MGSKASSRRPAPTYCVCGHARRMHYQGEACLFTAPEICKCIRFVKAKEQPNHEPPIGNDAEQCSVCKHYWGVHDPDMHAAFAKTTRILGVPSEPEGIFE
jgi:hypothetical protein